jgi:hypothetical protein
MLCQKEDQHVVITLWIDPFQQRHQHPDSKDTGLTIPAVEKRKNTNQ